MLSAPRRPALRAASLRRFRSSAPEKSFESSAMTARSTSSPSTLSFACIPRIACLPAWSGRGNLMDRSNRPGLFRPASRSSARFVAARTMTSSSNPSKPSISTRSCINVFSLSCCAPMAPAERSRPTASTSSRKMMLGARLLARPKSSLTMAAPCPARELAWNSLPATDRKGTPAWPANARAARVLPTPGGPSNRTPRGRAAPRRRKRSGFSR
mmetsp:Transcript_35716/g.78212  ORF Transcript_35716/g.78212 Transcript_35716/m.78212 type:complete len:213 (-) Transcript_35716:441-1079(-)